MDLFCLDIKKKEVSKTSCWCWCWCWCCLLFVVVRFGRRTTTTRRRARKKSGEIETGKRRGRGSGEERVRRVVAWAAFFRERKGKDSRFCFLFFRRPRIFPLFFYLNAHCVLLRETIARTLPLWEEHRRRRRRWVPGEGGEDVKRGGRTR